MDLRVPSGWFFALVGLILIGTGIFAPGTRAALTTENINLYCGIGMVLFGIFLLLLARRATRSNP